MGKETLTIVQEHRKQLERINDAIWGNGTDGMRVDIAKLRANQRIVLSILIIGFGSIMTGMLGLILEIAQSIK